MPEYPPSSQYYEDEIDIRAIIRTLLRNAWFIIGLAALMAVLGFSYAKFTHRISYQASTQVLITRPLFSTKLDDRLQSATQFPDVKALVELSLSDDVMVAVLEDPEIAGMFENGNGAAALRGKLQASLLNNSQLELMVSDGNPEQAAHIANVWAEKTAKHLNRLFSVDENALAQLLAQKETAARNFELAEENLLAYLPESRKEALEVSLEQGKETLRANLLKLSTLETIISDINGMQARLQNADARTALTLEESLSLLALHQRSVGSAGNIQLQISTPGVLGEGFTVSDARRRLESLVDSLQAQIVQLTGEIQAQENLIGETAVKVEEATHRLDQLTLQRDIARNAYSAISSQAEAVQITLAQGDLPFKVASQVLPPTSANGSNSLKTAVLGGALGFVLAIVLVLVISWWRAPEFSTEGKAPVG